MFVEPRALAFFQSGRRTSGVALVVTLSLLVLVAVAVIAFFGRTATNQQITSSSANGVVTATFADGAVQEVISGLQSEMWDLSGQPAPPTSSANAPTIYPMTNSAGGIPSRVLSSNDLSFPTGGTAPNPNSVYSQFGNLVKQSLFQKAIYSGGTSSAVPAPASGISTNTAATGGQKHDGAYWNQPQLVSVPNSDTTTLNQYLVPNWVYTNRGNSAPNDPNDPSKKHPTIYTANTGMEPSSNGALNPNTIVGRYAYNVYDIGGLLNANVAGYDQSASLQPSYASKDTMIVPGYKGSVQMADLSALNLNGTLTTNGANANTFPATPAANPGWQTTLPAFRYQAAASTPFATLFASGQYGGWLHPFFSVYDPDAAMNLPPNGSTPYLLPSASAYLKNSGFSSRQDLITWINSRLGNGTSTASWTLPYLTHFSYDTDAPTFTPNASRPRSNETLGTAGGNDSSRANDNLTNVTLTSVLDVHGYPLIKHRFPLSALALLDNIYPGHVPAALLDPSSTLYKQIQYDFGLIWNSSYNCWDYKTVDPDNYIGIKQLRTTTNTDPTKTVPNTRSPNFFELLKAAITTGSLGKEWGAGSYDSDPDNNLNSPPAGNSRYSATVYQIIQIGANIISQTTSNYCPTAICLNGIGQAPIVYGVKDLPYFYRTRLLTLTIDSFRQVDQTKDPMHDQDTGQYSTLAAVLVQPELWNPHAPNLLASTANYPVAFRVVPETTYQIGVTTSSAATHKWKQTGTYGPTNITGDYQTIGGPYCLPNLTYHAGASPDAYISFGWDSSNTDLLPKAADSTNGSAIGSFREPCPLAAPTFPANIKLDSSPKGPTMAVGYKVQSDGLPNTQITSTLSPTTASGQNVIPARFTQATPSNTALGFLVAYCCCGSGSDLTSIKATGGPMLLHLQYSMDGANFYNYDTIQSSFPSNVIEFAPPSGVQQTHTGVRADPRTHRWGMLWANIPYGQYVYGNWVNSARVGTPGTYEYQAGLTYAPTGNLAATNYGTGGNQSSLPQAPGWFGTYKPTATPWAIQMGWSQINQQTNAGYYGDPDGVVRTADSGYVTVGANSTASNATGLPQAMLAEYGNNQSSASGIAQNYESRPVVLNRPFQSVAELGYVFRDTPWRSLNFFTPESGDNALLDVFCIYGPDPYSYKDTLTTESGLVVGKVNLNTRQQPVLAALLQGASTTTVFPTSTAITLRTLSADQATKIAQGLVQWTTNTSDVTQGPLLNPAELVGKYTGSGSTGYNGFSSTLTSALAAGTTPAASSSIIKQERECVMHALTDAGTTRTWNLLIDMVAQNGQLTPNPSGLQSFVVNGERHVWVSVALDRVTGKVLKMQVEPVRL